MKDACVLKRRDHLRINAMLKLWLQAFDAKMSYSDSTAVLRKRFIEVGLNFEAFNAEVSIPWERLPFHVTMPPMLGMTGRL